MAGPCSLVDLPLICFMGSFQHFVLRDWLALSQVSRYGMACGSSSIHLSGAVLQLCDLRGSSTLTLTGQTRSNNRQLRSVCLSRLRDGDPLDVDLSRVPARATNQALEFVSARMARRVAALSLHTQRVRDARRLLDPCLGPALRRLVLRDLKEELGRGPAGALHALAARCPRLTHLDLRVRTGAFKVGR
jgi:hypothetical protein